MSDQMNSSQEPLDVLRPAEPFAAAGEPNTEAANEDGTQGF